MAQARRPLQPRHPGTADPVSGRGSIVTVLWTATRRLPQNRSPMKTSRTAERTPSAAREYAPYVEADWGFKNHWYPAFFSNELGENEVKATTIAGHDIVMRRAWQALRAARQVRPSRRALLAGADVLQRRDHLVLVSRLHLRAGRRRIEDHPRLARRSADRQGAHPDLPSRGARRNDFRLRRR